MAEAPALPWLVQRELAVLCASAGVETQSVQLETGAGDVRIAFNIATEMSVLPAKADIRAMEPIVISYASLDQIGLGPPRGIFSLRADFPRDLGHLNPVKPDAPVSICLAIAGLTPIYDQFGLEGVLERLRNFLRDAKIGALMQDGWEAVPYGDLSSMCPGSIDVRFFQDLAARQPGGGVAFGVARVRDKFAVLFPHEVPLAQLQAAIAAQKLERHGKNETLWIFVWPGAATERDAPVFSDWTTYADVRAGLASIGLPDAYEQALGQAITTGAGLNVVDINSAKVAVIVVGVWRPQPMRANIFGLSDDPAARKLEIRAYRIDGTGSEAPLQDGHRATAIVGHCFASPELNRFASGIDVPQSVTLVGAGALGSAIAEELLRAGTSAIQVIDPDMLSPHNLARHIGRDDDLFGPKGDSIQSIAEHLAHPQYRPQITAHHRDVTAFPTGDLLSLFGSTPIIDATASEKVRRYLCALQQFNSLTILRAEIFHRGRLGVLFQSYKSEADLLDLYCCMLLAAQDVPAICQWLTDEHVDPTPLDQLQFGFGCASQTVRLPNFVVRQHAAAFMPTIARDTTASSVGINPLSADFEPLGWQRIEVPAFHIWIPQPTVTWRVHVHPQVKEALERLRTAALPNETGGYLYGGWDAAVQTLSIVFASEPPPSTRATPSSLELGPAGETPEERRLLRATRSRLSLCGTWHSHPNDSAALSAKDRQTLRAHSIEDRKQYVPTLAIVVADGGFSTHLEV
jgi:hypothetical protein